ncbi:MAG: DUF302 domain-containing protein [Candidatus Marinimicrobia bacterium]|nr:DUF302 domain-containing protein [Candidatus Neomarinimicrobiota bacterium]
MMLIESQSPYGFDETVERFKISVADADWKIPATHDLQKTMAKFGHEVNPVTVFELCHPDHANEILKLNEERIVSTMMPCRLAIYEKEDGKTYYSRMNSGLVAKVFGGEIARVMAIAYEQNEDIVDNMANVDLTKTAAPKAAAENSGH